MLLGIGADHKRMVQAVTVTKVGAADAPCARTGRMVSALGPGMLALTGEPAQVCVQMLDPIGGIPFAGYPELAAVLI